MDRNELLLCLLPFIDDCINRNIPISRHELYPAYPYQTGSWYILRLELNFEGRGIGIADLLTYILSIMNTSLFPAQVKHIVSIHLYDADQHLRGIMNID